MKYYLYLIKPDHYINFYLSSGPCVSDSNNYLFWLWTSILIESLRIKVLNILAIQIFSIILRTNIRLWLALSYSPSLSLFLFFFVLTRGSIRNISWHFYKLLSWGFWLWFGFILLSLSTVCLLFLTLSPLSSPLVSSKPWKIIDKISCTWSAVISCESKNRSTSWQSLALGLLCLLLLLLDCCGLF